MPASNLSIGSSLHEVVNAAGSVHRGPRLVGPPHPPARRGITLGKSELSRIEQEETERTENTESDLSGLFFVFSVVSCSSFFGSFGKS